MPVILTVFPIFGKPSLCEVMILKFQIVIEFGDTYLIINLCLRKS